MSSKISSLSKLVGFMNCAAKSAIGNCLLSDNGVCSLLLFSFLVRNYVDLSVRMYIRRETGRCQNSISSYLEGVRIQFLHIWKVQNWKMSDSESVRIGTCQNWNLSELENVRLWKCQNWNLSEFESVRIGKCQNQKVSDLERVRVGKWPFFWA